MGVSYRFLATVDEGRLVLEWFRALKERPTESERENGTLFYFGQFGQLSSETQNSPLVNVFLPARRRNVLTTIGEVHFLATPITRFVGLSKLNRDFRDWLKANLCVFSHDPSSIREWDYYLEGSVRNHDGEIYALPGGIDALKNGAYFVADDEEVFVHGEGEDGLELVVRKPRSRWVTRSF